jgi:hypothetical protein
MANYPGSSTLSSLNGLYKQAYADSIERLQPEDLVLLKSIDFVEKSKQNGDFYNQPVIVAQEQGVTYAGSNSGAFGLNAPSSMQMKNAQIAPSQMLMRTAISYEEAARSASSATAFQEVTGLRIEELAASIKRKLEVQFFYGQAGLAKVASIAGSVVTVAPAEWSPGIWVGSENISVDVYDTTGVTLRGTTTVTFVDPDAKTLTLASPPAGTVATDVIWAAGAKGNEMLGLYPMLANPGSVFGISTTAYSLWKPIIESAGSAALTFTLLQKVAAKMKIKGAKRNVKALVNPDAFTDLQQGEAALRMYDQSYKGSKLEKGAESLLYHSQNGSIEIVPCLHVKENHAFVINMDDFKRIGGSEVTFKIPGKDGEEFFTQLAENAGYDIRCYTDQALFCKALGRQALITNIVNANDS